MYRPSWLPLPLVWAIWVQWLARTTEDREDRLREAGVDEAGLARVMGPIGIDIGARTPEETAVAVCAEIISLRTGRDAPSLRDSEGPIHRDLAVAKEAP